MEYNDIYTADRRLTGRVHLRGEKWNPGEYGLVVCVWVYDGHGNILMTKRAPGKSFAGTWENSGGVAQAGETSLQAIVRELFEETGILASPEEFELIDTNRDSTAFFDHYCLRKQVPLEQIVLLPGETCDVKWVSMDEVYQMVERREICDVISQQFLRHAPLLQKRQNS